MSRCASAYQSDPRLRRDDREDPVSPLRRCVFGVEPASTFGVRGEDASRIVVSLRATDAPAFSAESTVASPSNRTLFVLEEGEPGDAQKELRLGVVVGASYRTVSRSEASFSGGAGSTQITRLRSADRRSSGASSDTAAALRGGGRAAGGAT